MTSEQLNEALRMAAEVAAEDCEHDLLTAVDVLNKDRLRPEGRPLLAEPELRQVARAVFAELPANERIGVPGGEVAAVNAWLAERLRAQRLCEERSSVLAELLRRAADRLGTRNSDGDGARWI